MQTVCQYKLGYSENLVNIKPGEYNLKIKNMFLTVIKITRHVTFMSSLIKYINTLYFGIKTIRNYIIIINSLSNQFILQSLNKIKCSRMGHGGRCGSLVVVQQSGSWWEVWFAW